MSETVGRKDALVHGLGWVETPDDVLRAMLDNLSQRIYSTFRHAQERANGPKPA